LRLAHRLAATDQGVSRQHVVEQKIGVVEDELDGHLVDLDELTRLATATGAEPAARGRPLDYLSIQTSSMRQLL
jgi:hypothetical protein